MSMRKIALAAAALMFAAAAYSQQITRIAVVDLSKVITAYHSESKAVRDFEAKKDRVQSDIDRMSAEISRLLSLKAESDKADDKARSATLKSEIDEQTRKLSDYASIKQAELDQEAERLASSDLFTQELYRKIQSVAEFKGFSLVLNLKSRDGIMSSVLWYSPMIDITTDVIQALGASG